jgi:hypothetical protein
MELDLSRRRLQILPRLDPNLTILSCDSNELTSLPELPESLIHLYCGNNQLTTLPELPESLTQLSCFSNQLTTLPQLPRELVVLRCGNNQLTTLPELPERLIHLYCGKNQLTSLPKLPESLILLSCRNNPFIEPFKSFINNGDFNINTLRQQLNNYYEKIERGRNVSSLMQTVGANELRASKKWPNRNMANFQKRIPQNALSEISSYLSGVPRKTYANQQKILHENATRIPGAPGVGIGGRRILKTRKGRKMGRKTRKGRKCKGRK